jgi:hypothetical protein
MYGVQTLTGLKWCYQSFEHLITLLVVDQIKYRVEAKFVRDMIKGDDVNEIRYALPPQSILVPIKLYVNSPSSEPFIVFGGAIVFDLVGWS